MNDPWQRDEGLRRRARPWMLALLFAAACSDPASTVAPAPVPAAPVPSAPAAESPEPEPEPAAETPPPLAPRPPPAPAIWEDCEVDGAPFVRVRNEAHRAARPDTRALDAMLAQPPEEIARSLGRLAPDASVLVRDLYVPMLAAIARRTAHDPEARAALAQALSHEVMLGGWSREITAGWITVDREGARAGLEGHAEAMWAVRALSAFESSEAFARELHRLGVIDAWVDDVGLVDVIDALERSARTANIDVEGGFSGGFALERLVGLVADELAPLEWELAYGPDGAELTLRDRRVCARFPIEITGGDWFDLEDTLDGLNAGLERRGASRRLAALPGGQTYRVIAAPPSAVATLVERGLMPAPARIPRGENARMLGIGVGALEAVGATPTE